MIKFNANAYYLKGKIQEIITTVQNRKGVDTQAENKFLEGYEKIISSLLAELVLKQFKPEKKGVYFVEIDATFLESGKIKDVTEITCVRMDYTPATFKKAGLAQKKADDKAIARPDKDDE